MVLKMDNLKKGLSKLVLSFALLCAASFAMVGIVYSGLNAFVLASAAPSSAALAVGITAVTLSYLTLCFLTAAYVSMNEGVSLIRKTAPFR